MNRTSQVLLSGVCGLVAGCLLVFHFYDPLGSASQSNVTEEPQPLYWVAPMDSKFRRDTPGKSPMGMDLVPVFASDRGNNEQGVVSLSSGMINTLGVRTSPAERRSLEQTIHAYGTIMMADDQMVHIHPRVSGWIDQLMVNTDGEQVSADQALYSLYSPELVNAQQELLLALGRDNQALLSAARDRLRALNISDSLIRQIELDRTVRQNITFRSPQAGVIGGLSIRQGFYVQPGTTLMSIGSLESVWVDLELFERQLPFLTEGMQADMSLDYLPGQTWKGDLIFVDPMLNMPMRTVTARLRVDNPDRLLKPGMFASVSLTAPSSEPALIVPIEAVIRTGQSDRVVLALGEGRFQSVSVRLGRRSSTEIEILAGLEAGSRVVTSAQFLLDSESASEQALDRLSAMQPSRTTQPSLPSAMVEGLIVSVDSSQRQLVIDRGPVVKWNRPSATVEFSMAPALNPSEWMAGDQVQFVFVIDQGEFRIEFIEAIEAAQDVRGGLSSD